MNGIVVDSSVVAKWVLPEPDDAQAEHLFTAAAGGVELIVLDLAFAEVANAIWSRRRRKMITLTEAEQALRNLLRLPVRVERAADLLESALRIGIKYDRSIYDALFVALAEQLALQGVTADEPLYNAVHADIPMIVLLRDWK